MDASIQDKQSNGGWPISRKEYAGDLAYYSFLALLIMFIIGMVMYKSGIEVGQKNTIVELCNVAILAGEWDSMPQCINDIEREFDQLYEG